LKSPLPLSYQIFSSPLGEILVAGSGFAVSHVLKGADRNQLVAEFHLDHEGASPIDNSGYIREACDRIAAYLNCESQRIDVAIQVDGTDFERKVWHALRQIPYGATASYSEIAQAVGAPDAFRAVANACASNPVPLIIPCHRAVHKSGTHVGFGWGKEAKEFLLALERQHAHAGIIA
jgi:AraC family transcriptional regulator of adaptative response/methylated-DNA-[protein]-cysteine methyltransferase